jgi:murein DD-endopeptidase MepM/ murein hydrolase activator NlpD
MRQKPRVRTPTSERLAPWVALVCVVALWWLAWQALDWSRVAFPWSGSVPAGPDEPPRDISLASPVETIASGVAPAARSTPPEPVGFDDIVDLRVRDLLLPVDGVTADLLHPGFHETRGEERRHEALDILAPRGTSVLAVEDGKIAKLFNSVRGGLTIYQFDPDERFAYYYAHLDAYAPGITDAALVRRGQVLGYVGTTGNAPPTVPHLHFAIFKLGPERRWWQGNPIDPYLIWR